MDEHYLLEKYSHVYKISKNYRFERKYRMSIIKAKAFVRTTISHLLFKNSIHDNSVKL